MTEYRKTSKIADTLVSGASGGSGGFRAPAQPAAARETVGGDNRRQFARVQLSMMIEIRSAADFTGFMQTFLHDISLGGMYIRTDQPRPIGSRVTVRLPIRRQKRYCELSGEVVRVIEPHQTPETFPVPGMAVRFDPLNERDQAVVKALIQNKRGKSKA